MKRRITAEKQYPLTIILLDSELDVASQCRWATQLARHRRTDLLVLQERKGFEDRIENLSVESSGTGQGAELVQDVLKVVDEVDGLSAGVRPLAEFAGNGETPALALVYVRVALVHFSNATALRQSVLQEIRRERAVVFTQLRAKNIEQSDIDLVKENRLFVRYLSCDLVICQGWMPTSDPVRILAVTGSDVHSRSAFKLSEDLRIASEGTLTALHVNPDVGPDSQWIGQRRIQRFLGRNSGGDGSAIPQRVEVRKTRLLGVQAAWKEGQFDLIVMGASWATMRRYLNSQFDKTLPVVLVRKSSPHINRFRECLEEGTQKLIPQIDREDRINLVDRLQSSVAWNFDFVALMVLSTTMAAVGLMQNSAAVVIGAMLVAPLMTPLLGLGLALVQGNRVLARLSLRSVLLGLSVSLGVGFLTGIFTPGFEEPTREMLARGGPGLLDLFVAFAAGLAAAYASSRPNLFAALPGVAIAAALVPPIAAAGLALSIGDLTLATGALILFCVNMVTIILASMGSLWAVGFRSLKRKSRWTGYGGASLVFAVLILGIFLSLKPSQSYEVTKEIPVGLLDTIEQNLTDDYKFNSLWVAYDELGVQLNVRLIGKEPASDKLSAKIRTEISSLYKTPVRVRLLTQIERRELQEGTR